MDNPFNLPPLSKEYICNKMEIIDKAISKLDSSDSPYVAPDLSRNDLFDIFMEARDWLLTQRAALGEPESTEDLLHDSLEYRRVIQTMRNGNGHST